MEIHYEKGTVGTMQVYNNNFFYPTPMVVETHPLQDKLFAGTLTRCDIYNQCMWKGSGAIGFKPKYFAAAKIGDKYGEVLQSY